MPRASRKGDRLDGFFRSLRASILEAWSSPEGFAYDRVLYAVGYPYRTEDLSRVLKWAGRPSEERALPPLKRLNETLTRSVYPELASGAPPGVSIEAWSAILHFLDPSYPLATPGANRGLLALGFPVAEALSPTSYAAYLEALDELKERAPVWAVPETNWYLARVIEVGLEAFAPEPPSRSAKRAAATS